MPHVRIRAATILLWAALLLAAWAVLVFITGGFRVEAGPLRISATTPSRLLFLSAVALVCYRLSLAQGTVLARRRTLVIVLVLFWLAAIGQSHPQRVGDGAEYMAVALNVGHLKAPSLSREDVARLEGDLSRLAAFQGGTISFPSLTGRDGRQDVPHFWLYSVLAAPFVAAARGLGLHPAYGFTALNLLFIALTTAVAARSISEGLTILLVTGPIIWWIDKAHPEVLLLSMTTLAVVLMKDAPWWSLVAMGVAAAQNQAFAPAFCIFAATAMRSRGLRDTRAPRQAGFRFVLGDP